MKLARVGPKGSERPAVLDAPGRPRDLSGVLVDIGGPNLPPETLHRLRALDLESLPILHETRYGPCVAQVDKIDCVGLNFVDHALEVGFESPAEPVLFMKATTSLSGANDPIVPPTGASKLDSEVELGVVMGRTVVQGTSVAGLDDVARYCVFNDVSERAFQLERGGQRVKGKSADSFGPCGPWLVTADEVADPQALDLRLMVNGEARQSGWTRDMIFSVADLIAHINQFMTLSAGDIIASGTPLGVGMGMRPPRYLQLGDELVVEISGLGGQQQRVAARRQRCRSLAASR